MARYSLQDARRYIAKAIIRLNRVRGLNISLLDLEYADLMGWDFIKAHLFDKTYNYKFDSMLNEFIFTREDTMTNLDTAAGILNKDLNEEQKIVLRIAYTILRDWKETRNVETD